jgi:hypothetical protein
MDPSKTDPSKTDPSKTDPSKTDPSKLVLMTSGIILMWLGYGWTRLEGCNGWKLDKTCSSVAFYFEKPTVKRIWSRYVVVVVDLFLLISCMQRCILMGTHLLADYDKRIADS